MAEALQSSDPGPGHRADDDARDRPLVDDQGNPVEQRHEQDNVLETRRRASLSKEIRAGWRRALGH